jgi:rfaE bifunctional protein kinase chain/domain
MLSESLIEQILGRLPGLRIGVVGDLFLDRYLDIDASLNEPSIETGLDAYQVARVRSYPGALGTVINNLVALGVGTVCPVAVIGDDGEGYELRQALARMRGVAYEAVFADADRRTPTYTKPMLCAKTHAPRELNRLDIKNREALGSAYESKVMEAVADLWPRMDILMVLDQVSEANCGVVTDKVRQHLELLAKKDPQKTILVDSRERIGLFRLAWLKPNEAECLKATGETTLEAAVLTLVQNSLRPVFCTRGRHGILIGGAKTVTLVPAYAVAEPIDPVGAGDSTSAGIACAVAAGATEHEAAAFGNLVASITIQQLGTTGTATAEQVRARWREVIGKG